MKQYENRNQQIIEIKKFCVMQKKYIKYYSLYQNSDNNYMYDMKKR
jgi:hypothetical protein